MRLVSARRDADLMDRAPEAIAGMRVIMSEIGRALARGRADEDQSQAILQLVGKFFQLDRAFFVGRNGNRGLRFASDVAQMSAATCGFADRPGYRFVHPGYAC